MKTRLYRTALLLLALSAACTAAQSADVTVHFTVSSRSQAGLHKPTHLPLGDVVFWLTPMDAALPATTPRNSFRLVQKNKEFTPHLLVVPAGSNVDFPNLDPFFHNVFSLFNGKRFDLGLYEAGSHRAVRFDREGVSYIFCNIHPEMGAIVVALNTPYYAVSDSTGTVTVHNVPPGRYHLHVWGEQLQLDPSTESQQVVQVTPEGAALGTMALSPAPDPLTGHKNKFGADYPATPATRY